MRGAYGLFDVGGITTNSVHPHVRGAYEEIKTLAKELGGSPPRAWGLCILRFNKMLQG